MSPVNFLNMNYIKLISFPFLVWNLAVILSFAHLIAMEYWLEWDKQLWCTDFTNWLGLNNKKLKLFFRNGRNVSLKGDRSKGLKNDDNQASGKKTRNKGRVQCCQKRIIYLMRLGESLIRKDASWHSKACSVTLRFFFFLEEKTSPAKCGLSQRRLPWVIQWENSH